jgi:hypothetical protein
MTGNMPSNETFIIAAYALTWLVLLGYAIRLWRATTRARAEHARITGPALKEHAE